MAAFILLISLAATGLWAIGTESASYYLLEGSVDIGDDNVKVTPPPVTQEVKSRLVSIISENRG